MALKLWRIFCDFGIALICFFRNGPDLLEIALNSSERFRTITYPVEVLWCCFAIEP